MALNDRFDPASYLLAEVNWLWQEIRFALFAGEYYLMILSHPLTRRLNVHQICARHVFARSAMRRFPTSISVIA